MSTGDDQIFVKSHVARDLLQSASLFRTDKLVVWEYVSNSLQYVDAGVNPVVKVMLDNKQKQIRIADNGRGMNWQGLQNFFVMHGENQDRANGRPGRGRFGTGKSAALGIANLLRLTTVRDGKRSVVEIRRDEIEKMTSEAPIPVHLLERELPTNQANGTLVEIEGIHLRTLDQAGIIRFIERHLARLPKNVKVFVNHRECEFEEPLIADEYRFQPGVFREKLGDVELILKVSKAPLEEDLRGIAIFSKGVWHQTTLAGSEGRELSQYIFGEIDVSRLEEDNSPIPPFDVSRSMSLNPNNELVRTIFAFLSQKIEEVRRQLVAVEKRRRSEEEQRRLAQQANEIAQVINQDFHDFRQKIAKVRARVAGGLDLYESQPTAATQEGEDTWLFGSALPAVWVSPTGGPGASGGTGGEGTEPRQLAPQVEPDPQATEKRGRPAGGNQNKAKSFGGFQVCFEHMGEADYRAKYLRDERTIYINLDHPQLVAAIGQRSSDDPIFKRLAYEIAFSEYAIALAHELNERGEYNDPSDPIVDIRETMNRIAKRAASLYA